MGTGNEVRSTSCDIEDRKFDALVEYNSPAADHIRDQARKVVDAYIEHSVILQNALDHPYVVPAIAVDEFDLAAFNNALHAGYSGLNKDELAFAKALDKTKRVWCRNPSQGGFGIPLLDRGNTRTFNPDFLAWTEKTVVAIDTKGDHLITEDAGRKLFFIEKVEDGPELVIRLVTKGRMAGRAKRGLWQAQWQYWLHGMGAEARQAASDPLRHDRRGRAAMPEGVKGQETASPLSRSKALAPRA